MFKHLILAASAFVLNAFATVTVQPSLDYEPFLAVKFANKMIINCKGDKNCKKCMALLIKHDEQIAQLLKKKLNNEMSAEETAVILKQLDPTIPEGDIQTISQFTLDGSSCEKFNIKATKLNDEKTIVAFEIDAQIPDFVPELSEGQLLVKEVLLSVASMLRITGSPEKKEAELKTTEVAVKASSPKEAQNK